MRLAAPLLALLVLSACNKADEAPPQQTAAPADTPSMPAPMAVSDFPGDFNATGAEPFWGVEIRKDALTLNRPDQPGLVEPNPGPVMEKGQGVWKTGSFTLTLAASVCNDGMSDRTYPYTAILLLDGKPLQGCAARPDAFKPGEEK